MCDKSNNAKDIANALAKGELPPLSAQPFNNSTAEGIGIEISQRGLGKTTFGLQRINEGVEPKKKD